VLLKLGDSVTTDHISPPATSPKSPPESTCSRRASPKADFNSYGSRRGNHEVMVRGTFANVRIRNQIAPGHRRAASPPTSRPARSDESVYDARERYQAAGTPLVVLGGEQYGTGSSRDWAAKGTCCSA
jgi:aconitate hydratase